MDRWIIKFSQTQKNIYLSKLMKIWKYPVPRFNIWVSFVSFALDIIRIPYPAVIDDIDLSET